MNKYDNKGQVFRSIRKIAENHRPNIFAFKRAPKDNCKWLQIFLAGIAGPSETPYEGGIFYISISLLDTFYNYKFQFLTKILHPNISDDGIIQIEMPSRYKQDIEDGLIWIIELLKKPKWELATNQELVQIYNENEEKYFSYVEEATAMYAI
ncbi:unnamed protein product [Blepharisma stoltei]|uniref:UBC core domain-containing protein n=1 Tax=Blepharisma stoltei TaxID=1481888 RepID=A0AAU9IV06_9CILI|nr:unnamed protein product [Blepharisma stoltei]